MSLSGVNFKYSDITTSTPCKNSTDYLMKAAIILQVNEGAKNVIDFVSRCKSAFDSELLNILEIPKRGDLEAIKSYLTKRVKNRSRRFKLLSHLNQIAKVRKEQRAFISLSESLRKQEKEVAIKETERNKFLKKISQLPSSPWKTMLLMNLSTYSDNVFWTQKLLHDLNTYGPYVPLFYGLDKIQINDTLLANFFSTTVSKVHNKLKNNDHKFIVSRLVDYSGKKIIYKELEGRFSALWSLNELRELYLDPFIKFNYFDFLLEKMLQRASENEIKEHLRETIKKELIRDMRTRQMWTLQLFYPKDEELRKSILNKMGKIWLEGTFLEKYQVLINLENKTIKNGLSKRFPGMSRPLYKVEKDFYTELLFSGRGTLFAFGELYRLGDHRDDYLWLLAF